MSLLGKSYMYQFRSSSEIHLFLFQVLFLDSLKMRLSSYVLYPMEMSVIELVGSKTLLPNSVHKKSEKSAIWEDMLIVVSHKS